MLEENTLILTQNGLHINVSSLTNKEINSIKKFNTIIDTEKKALLRLDYDPTLTKFTTSRKYPNVLTISRFSLFLYNQQYPDNPLVNFTKLAEINEGNVINIQTNNIKLSNIQRQIKKSIIKIFNKDVFENGVYLKLNAGQGKSYVAASLISSIKKKTLIIVHRRSIIDQWAKVINAAFPNTTVGYYYSNKKVDGDIIIMVNRSCLQKTYTINNKTMTRTEYYAQFGFVIVDEAHECASKQMQSILKYVQTYYILALSATPITKVYDKGLLFEFGQILDCNHLLEEEKNEFKVSLNKVEYYGDDIYTEHHTNEALGTTNIAKTLNMLVEDPKRNETILNILTNELKDSSRFIYVFSDRRDHLLHLNNTLIEYTAKNELNYKSDLCTNEDEFLRLVGGASSDEMHKAETKSRVIFTTYAFMGTGKSIPKMNTVILTHPRRNKIEQFIGRILRLGSDYSIVRKIYDIVDMKLSLSRQYSVRQLYYKKIVTEPITITKIKN